MSIIEGVGDEVIILLGIVIALLLIGVAWWSTGVRGYGSNSSVWYVQMQTWPQRRVLQVVHVDEAAAEQLETQANTTTLRVNVPERGEEATPLLTPGPSEASTSAREDTEDDLDSDKSDEGGTILETNQPCDDDDVINEAATTTAEAGTSAGDTQIRLKFLDETQKMVGTFLSKSVREFKSQHFGSEVNKGKVIRLIYQGQLLRDDERSLASYGLTDNCIVHCHVSTTPFEGAGDRGSNQPNIGYPRMRNVGNARRAFDSNNNRGEENRMGLQPGRFAYSLFALIFFALWATYTFHPTLFQFPALFSLIICTAVFFALWIRDQLGTIAARARERNAARQHAE